MQSSLQSHFRPDIALEYRSCSQQARTALSCLRRDPEKGSPNYCEDPFRQWGIWEGLVRDRCSDVATVGYQIHGRFLQKSSGLGGAGDLR